VTFSDFSRAGAAEPLGTDVPRGAGPATSIALDLLCCIPAMLVLARRVSDRQYVLRPIWAVLPLGLLAIWGFASVFWAADKFAALVMAFHWLAACALIWAMAQLVRSWLRLRLVAALCAGLLLAYFGYSLVYKTVDLPDLRRTWEKDRKQLLEQRGLADDPFLARQFENKVLAGELMGFFVSPNTMAAIVVLLLVVTTAIAAQRLWDDPRDGGGWALLALWPMALWMIWQTSSRTAYVTPVLAVGLLALAWLARDWLARRATAAYWAGVAIVAIVAAAVVGHGLAHQSLFHESLTFRWNYWVGAVRIAHDHALQGVGLDNFSQYYLAARLPQAAEEVKDPHNLFVRFVVELGVIGGALAFAWLLRTAWELTRPNASPVPVESMEGTKPRLTLPLDARYNGIKTIALIGAIGMVINGIASLDLTSDPVFVFLEILRRGNMLALLIIGAVVASVRSLKDPALDDRPAPLLLCGILVALAVFLLHNMIDFSIFEPGPLTLFAVLLGAALGVRQPSVAGRRRRTIVAAVALGASAVAWLIAAGFILAPTAMAEDAAHDANRALQSKRPVEAIKLLLRAREYQPLNGDYALRAAQAMMVAPGQRTEDVLAVLKSAINANPRDPTYYLARARYLMQSPNRAAYAEQITSDFAKAVELNPNDVALRIEYGDALRLLGRRDKATAQYEAALSFNEKLKENEPKRLRGERLAEVRKRLAETRAGR
jgi:O-antigen ligase